MSNQPEGHSITAKRVLSIVLPVLLIIAIIGVIAFAVYTNSIDSRLHGSNNASIKEALTQVDTEIEDAKGNFDKPFYALVLGSDQRDDEVARSDVMMLVRVDTENGKVSILSLPRDLMVDLDEYGTNKINAAYAYGGAALAIDTVEDLANVPISHYVEVHFSELEDVIDNIGGLDVDVPVANDETGVSSFDIDLSEGMTHMDGETALSFVRERYGYNRGDFQRADNQRLVAMALVKAVLDRPVYEMPGMVETVSDTITTDMDLSELVALASLFQDRDDITFYSAIAPCSSEYIDGGWYDILDEDAFAKMMKMMEAGRDISKAEDGESAGSTATGGTHVIGEGNSNESSD